MTALYPPPQLTDGQQLTIDHLIGEAQREPSTKRDQHLIQTDNGSGLVTLVSTRSDMIEMSRIHVHVISAVTINTDGEVIARLAPNEDGTFRAVQIAGVR